MKTYDKSDKLERVRYDIRGPVLKEAKRMEAEGIKVLKLNIGNPGAFGFNVPDEVIKDIAANVRAAQGYGDSKGIADARKAIIEDYRSKGVSDIGMDDVFIGNGVSELIMVAMQSLVNPGDEVLIPMPDYPLWTAAVNFSGGTAVHYRCDEASSWNPDMADLRSKLSEKTVAIVVINPNNPTGAVYSRETLEEIASIAKERGLIVYSDEIYSRITYDGAKHIPMATLDPEILTVSFDGLSKAWLAAGFRAGWMVISGNKKTAAGYFDGLETLTNMRLCPNMLAQLGIKAALENIQSVNPLLLPGGRFLEQRDTAVSMVSAIPGLSVVKPQGALYCFPKIDTARFNITNDEKFVMDFLREQQVLLVHGTGFNWKEPDHFRIVLLPDRDTLADAIGRLGKFLANYRQD